MSVFHNNALIGAGGGTGAAAAAGVATKSLRFNSDHSSSLTRTPSSASNRRTFTFSCWVKRSKLGGSEGIFDCRPASGSGMTDSNLTVLYFDTDNTLKLSGAVTEWRSTSQVFRDASSFYHIVLAVDTTSATAADRIKLYVNGSQVTDFGSNNNPSQNHEFAWNLASKHAIGSNTLSTPTGHINAYLADIYFIDGSQLDPTSFGAYDDNGVWQAAAYSGTFGTNGFHLLDFENESTVGHDSSGNENDFTAVNILAAQNQYLGDLTGTQRSGFPWTSIFNGNKDQGSAPNPSSSFTFSPSPTLAFSTLAVYAYKDTSPGTLKINGTDITSQIPNHNGIGTNQRTVISGISSPLTSIQSISNGNLANIVLAGIEIDGELLLDTAAEVDVLFDVPTNGDQSDTGAGGEVSGNYAVFNALEDAASGGNAALSNGNLQIDGSSSEQFRAATIPVTSGKWYFEIVQSAGTDFGPGVWAYPLSTPSSAFHANENYRYNSNGGVYDESAKITDYSSFAVGDVIGTALDMDNGKVYFSKNGTWQNSGDPAAGTNPAATGLTGQWVFGASTNGNSTTLNANWGQRSFSYTAPTGFKALCTTNLPTPTIADGRDHFYALASTGTFGGGTVTDSDANFTPDWVWVKRRNAAERHKLYDILRGTDGTRFKHLESDGSDAEGSGESGITAFVAGGYTSEGGGHINSDGQPFVSWMWNAGTSTASNTDGSGTSSVQVRANTTAGFSIVTYTGGSSSPANSDSGDSFGHGLGAAPDLVICKKRSGTNSWPVYHRAAPTGALILDATNANDSSSFLFAKKDPTSTEVFLGNNPEINNSSHNYVAYCFAPVDGFSFFGEYSGNGSSDGPFLHTNHRPAWIMVKCHDTSTSSTNWIIWDTARDPSNMAEIPLRADLPNAEIAASDNYDIDILSNGFKIRTSNGGINHASRSYVFASFAENPFQANGGLAR